MEKTQRVSIYIKLFKGYYSTNYLSNKSTCSEAKTLNKYKQFYSALHLADVKNIYRSSSSTSHFQHLHLPGRKPTKPTYPNNPSSCKSNRPTSLRLFFILSTLSDTNIFGISVSKLARSTKPLSLPQTYSNRFPCCKCWVE